MATRTLSNLVWPDGQSNPSGMKSIAYFMFKRDIKSWPKIPASPASAAEAVTYDGDFEMQDGKKAISIYSTQGVGKVEFESTGEKDCKMFNNKLTLSYPDMNDESVDFCNSLVNSNGVFIVPYYVAGGKLAYVVIGGEKFDAEISPKGTSGDKAGSAKGLTLEVTAPDALCLPRYTGIIELSDGTLNCETGVFTATPSTPSGGG